jgi:hypothetical protein
MIVETSLEDANLNLSSMKNIYQINTELKSVMLLKN